MRTGAALLFAIVFAQAAAAEERKLTGREITAELSGHDFTGENQGRPVEQSFMASGSTMYTDGGNVSQGLWEVRADQYCSQWPPHEAWSCYDVTRDGPTITFIGSSGNRYPMTRSK